MAECHFLSVGYLPNFTDLPKNCQIFTGKKYFTKPITELTPTSEWTINGFVSLPGLFCLAERKANSPIPPRLHMGTGSSLLPKSPSAAALTRNLISPCIQSRNLSPSEGPYLN